MSWSFYAIGKPKAVIAKVAEEAAQTRCAEPEETVRKAALAAITASLEGQAASDAVVRIEASGHQSEQYAANGKSTGTYTNQVKVNVQPVFGFVE